MTGKRGGSSVLAFFRGAGRERSPNRTPAKDSSGIDTVRYTPRVDRDSLDESGTARSTGHMTMQSCDLAVSSVCVPPSFWLQNENDF